MENQQTREVSTGWNTISKNKFEKYTNIELYPELLDSINSIVSLASLMNIKVMFCEYYSFSKLCDSKEEYFLKKDEYRYGLGFNTQKLNIFIVFILNEQKEINDLLVNYNRGKELDLSVYNKYSYAKSKGGDSITEQWQVNKKQDIVKSMDLVSHLILNNIN